jgi:hypothetical protein
VTAVLADPLAGSKLHVDQTARQPDRQTASIDDAARTLLSRGDREANRLALAYRAGLL